MAPISTRQLFVLNLPAIAILLSYFWYKRKRIGAPSDPGDKETAAETDPSIETKKSSSLPVDIQPRSTPVRSISSSAEGSQESPCAISELHSVEDTPNKSFSRSFSAPIPIVLPKELRYTKTLNISDEELDQQIEKLKSVKKTDPFSLISQGRSTNSLPPSQKLNGYRSLSPTNLQSLSETATVGDKSGENNNQEVVSLDLVASCQEYIVEEIIPSNNVEVLKETSINQPVAQVLVASCEEDIEEIIPTNTKEVDQETGTPFERVVEKTDAINNQQVVQELVASCEEDIEEIVPTNNKQIPQETVTSCERVVEEIGALNNQEIIAEAVNPIGEVNIGKVVTVSDQEVVPSEENSPQSETVIEGEIETSSSSSFKEMTSTNNIEIVHKSDSPSIDKIEEMTSDDKEIVTKSDSPCLDETDKTISSITKDLTEIEIAPSSAQGNSDPVAHPSTEDVASSAENSISADNMDATIVQSEEASPTASTGAIPKQPKKKKFRKLQCDLKDLGSKLQETRQRPGAQKIERRRDGRKSRSDSGCEREEMQGQSSCRESANVSPCDTMMAACGSLDSLNSSEGSNDSGKGCSDTTTPPPQPNTFYEFLIPVDKVGKLIGKRGCFITRVYTETNAHIVVRDHPYDNQKKICIVEGTEEAIHKAMGMVKQRFPREKLKPFMANNAPQASRIENYLPLPAGVNTETHISCIVSPNHLFLQQPFHPSFHSFTQLHEEIEKLYISEDVPLLPKPVAENTLCVAFMFNGWSRVLILSADQETEIAYVRCMDYGGYAYVPFAKLKQIRKDFFYLPFQAVECFLANIEPVDDVWPEEAYELVRELTTGFYVFTHIVDFTPENIPLVNCQVIRSPQHLVWINEQLVLHGFARWTNQPEFVTEAVAAEDC